MNKEIKKYYNTPVLLELLEHEGTLTRETKYVYQTMLDFLLNNYSIVNVKDLSEINTQEEILELLDNHKNCIYRRKSDIYSLCIALSNTKDITCRYCKLKNLEDDTSYKFIKKNIPK